MQHFTATLTPVKGGGHFVVVPPEIAEAAGLRYGVRVRGTLDGVEYRSSLMMYSGVFHLGVHKATIAAASAPSGANVKVAIEIDDQPLPTDTVPKDLAAAIKGNTKAKAAWEAQSPSHRREHVKHVLEAKKAETRQRRIAATVKLLAATPVKKKAKATTARRTPARGASKRRASR
jgi:hypothetical protein